ncbi:MAG: helix-turn-helix domain-containing protein [Actinomycetia bacterium]|nr:helix-turn-helix domain-containing protein [Actinomycetes bacterium]MCP4963018.1 helix-turn-helix domain-containing protein [Actinomycetes bacterium]
MALLTTRQVQDLFRVDRSTIYRMAEDGRLPAVKVGRQWRFPSDQVELLLGHSSALDAAPLGTNTATRSAVLQDVLPADTAQAVADLTADLFSVMAVVTDMAGRPLTTVANPCGFFSSIYNSIDAPDRCSAGWRRLGEQIDLEPRFVTSHLGFLCARSFIRSGSTLAGMVIVGGVAPEVWPPPEGELEAIAAETETPIDTIRNHILEVSWIDKPHQDWIVRNLSQVSDLISRLADDHGRLVERLDTIAALAGAASPNSISATKQGALK